MKLIIQIPAFNEERSIASTIADLPRSIDGIAQIETLLIDDGSTDRTIEAARKAGITHVVQLLNHRGLSTAFTTGINAALGLGADIIVNTDADNQYRGSDIANLVRPILNRQAEVVVGDRVVRDNPHMSALKRLLQRFGSWSVGRASGVQIPDVTSGFRAFSREAAFQINVFNPFTYTLETIIQAGNRNLSVTTIPITTNAPVRPSRLYKGVPNYLRKSIVTIFRIYTLYKPLKTFSFIAAVFLAGGLFLGARFLYHFFNGQSEGHVQSLILAAILLIVGFQTFLIGLVSDLISVNRRLSEEILIRTKKLAPAETARPQRSSPPPSRGREPRRDFKKRGDHRPVSSAGAGSASGAAAPEAAVPTAQTQWVWLMDEKKLEDHQKPRTDSGEAAASRSSEDLLEGAEARPRPSAKRRRRRRGSGGGGAARGEQGAIGSSPIEPSETATPVSQPSGGNEDDV